MHKTLLLHNLNTPHFEIKAREESSGWVKTSVKLIDEKWRKSVIKAFLSRIVRSISTNASASYQEWIIINFFLRAKTATNTISSCCVFFAVPAAFMAQAISG